MRSFLRVVVCALARTLAGAELFDFRAGFDPTQVTARDVTLAAAADALEIKGTLPASEGGVVFAVPERWRDLSRFRYVEADLENTGDRPLRFTFWALSGHGWGGASTFTPAGGPAAGRETLAPGRRDTFRIDLHVRYSGRDVYTKATDPAAIRWLELVVGDGFDWRPAKHVFVTTPEIVWTGGVKKKLNALDRPQLVFDARSEPVTLLCAGAYESGRARSFNVAIPLRRP